MGVGRGRVVDRQHPLGPPLDRPQAGVGRDRVEPRAQRASPLELREPAPGVQQRILERVLGVGHRAEHPIAVGVQGAAMGLDQPGEGVLVAPAGSLEQPGLVHRIPPAVGAGPWAARTRSRRRPWCRRRFASRPGPRGAPAGPTPRARGPGRWPRRSRGPRRRAASADPGQGTRRCRRRARRRARRRGRSRLASRSIPAASRRAPRRGRGPAAGRPCGARDGRPGWTGVASSSPQLCSASARALERRDGADGHGLAGRRRPGRARATIAPTAENPARTATAGANPSRNASGEA